MRQQEIYAAMGDLCGDWPNPCNIATQRIRQPSCNTSLYSRLQYYFLPPAVAITHSPAIVLQPSVTSFNCLLLAITRSPAIVLQHHSLYCNIAPSIATLLLSQYRRFYSNAVMGDLCGDRRFMQPYQFQVIDLLEYDTMVTKYLLPQPVMTQFFWTQ